MRHACIYGQAGQYVTARQRDIARVGRMILALLCVSVSLSWMPGDWVSDAQAVCQVKAGVESYPDGYNLKDASCDSSGNLRITSGTLISGENQGMSQETSFIATSGAVVRLFTLMTAVTTNTTSWAMQLPGGGKTPIAKVSGTGAVTATVKLYGDNDQTTTGGKLLCTITLSAATEDVDDCDQFTKDYPFYYATSESVTGTDATVEFIVAVGSGGSGAAGGGGGAVTNAGTFAVQESGAALTALQLIDNMISGTGANISQINGVTPLMGAGGTGTGSPRTTESNDSQLSAGVGATGDAAATVGSTGSLTAKGRLMTSQLDTIATAIASTLTAAQLIDDDQTGSSINHRVSVGTTEDETEIKATAGRLLSISATNTNAAARYLRCANLTAANTTPGTSSVFFGIALPGGGGVAMNFAPSGIAFSTALTCWLVTGAAETDVAEVAANEVNWNIGYK